MNNQNFPITEPILRARVAIITDAMEMEQDLAHKNFKDLITERRHYSRLKESLLWSLMMNLTFIVTLIGLVLGSGDMHTVAKIGFTICLLVVGALPAWRLWKLFRDCQ